jgi:hypothetical protein
MPPHPTDHLGLLRVPGPALNALSLRFAPLSDRDQFSQSSWVQHALTKSTTFTGWWEIDLDVLALSEDDYEYEFVDTAEYSPLLTAPGYRNPSVGTARFLQESACPRTIRL